MHEQEETGLGILQPADEEHKKSRVKENSLVLFTLSTIFDLV